MDWSLLSKMREPELAAVTDLQSTKVRDANNMRQKTEMHKIFLKVTFLIRAFKTFFMRYSPFLSGP
jgi:hypothetical protein